MSSDGSDDEDLPTAAECDQRCQQFADITGTDSALAMFYLQDRKWELERAINAFFEDSGGRQGAQAVGVKVRGEEVKDAAATRQKSSVQTEQKKPEVEDPDPHRIRLMTWNIDGLDPKNRRSRAIGVCNTINKENPHAVFLQEVIGESQAILQEQCSTYHIIPGGEEDYYTAIMLKSGLTKFKDAVITPFRGTLMMRNILTVKCSIKGENFHLMTSHLESTKNYAKERQSQLKTAFEATKKADPDATVIFGGDLNLRDDELAAVGGIPDGMYDVWEVTGKRPEAKFTWDMVRNDNLEWSSKFRPRCRFDRLYIKYPQRKTVEPVYLELVGLERLTSCQRFPSDHWGILTHYNILSKIPKK